MSDTLVRIKRAVLAGHYAFSEKASLEIEANSPAYHKTEALVEGNTAKLTRGARHHPHNPLSRSEKPTQERMAVSGL